jgi:hypothetical protein
MSIRKQSALNSILNKLASEPAILISKERLRKAYGQKLTCTVYRDLLDRMPAGVRPAKLKLVHIGSNVVIINDNITEKLSSYAR